MTTTDMADTQTSSVRPAGNRGLLIVIALLLLALVALNAFQVLTTYQQNKLAEERAATHAERVAAAEALVAKQQDVIGSLLSEYEKAAYENVSVDRIAEQQLIAAEHMLAALQVMATQNSQIIELLATAP